MPSFSLGGGRLRRHLRRYSDQLIGLATILVILLVWETGSATGLLNSYHFPRPTKLASTLVRLVDEGFPRGITAMVHIRATFSRIVKGYALATALAIPLGLFIGRSALLDRASNPLITYASFWIILTNVIQAVKGVDARFIRAAETLGASDRQIFFRVILPGSLPRIFGGMKVALGIAFLVIVAVEMIGTVEGLGALIMEARTFYRSDAAMVGMIFIAIVGFALAKGLDRLERWLLPWAVGLEEVER